MRIGIDCRTILNPRLGERAGVGHYTYYLVKHLLKNDKKNEYVLFFDYRLMDVTEFKQKNVKLKHFPFSQYQRYLPFTYSHMLISAALIKEGLNIYHSPANVIPLTYPKTSVITVHDLAIYKKPEWFPRGQKFSTKLLVPRSLKKADQIIAVSRATKRDIIKLFKIKPEKIKIVYEGVGMKKIKEGKKPDIFKKYRLKNKYIIFLGTIEPRKNLVGLINAYSKLIKKKKFENYDLVLAGAEGWKYDQIFKTIEKNGLGDRVKFLGYVSHNEKIDLMKRAEIFVFPSFYEGFGLPLLEAISLGVPAISSSISSMPEVAGKSVIYINPESEEAILKAMVKILSSSKLRKKMKLLGIEQARGFDWDKCAKETIKIYEKLGAKKEKSAKKVKNKKG